MLGLLRGEHFHFLANKLSLSLVDYHMMLGLLRGKPLTFIFSVSFSFSFDLTFHFYFSTSVWYLGLFSYLIIAHFHEKFGLEQLKIFERLFSSKDQEAKIILQVGFPPGGREAESCSGAGRGGNYIYQQSFLSVHLPLELPAMIKGASVNHWETTNTLPSVRGVPGMDIKAPVSNGSCLNIECWTFNRWNGRDKKPWRWLKMAIWRGHHPGESNDGDENENLLLNIWEFS